MVADKELVLFEQIGDVGIVRLNDPDTLNAVSLEMCAQIDAAIERCMASCRAMVLTSVGRAFSSGANLSSEEAVFGNASEVDVGATLETHVNPLMRKLVNLEIPWISAVRGAAAGVGCSLALAGDMIVASETAYFFLAFSRVGLVPDGGSPWLLTRTIGRPRAMELMFMGEKLSAATAMEWGLINKIVPDDQLDQTAIAIATKLASGPTRSYSLIRQLSWNALNKDLDASLNAERIAQRDASRTADAREGVKAFLEKRMARFTGN